MPRVVLLLHGLADGSSHLDLLVEGAAGEDPEERALLAFRLPVDLRERVLEGRLGAVSAERLPDHRRLYIDFVGPIPGDRGAVARVGRGTAHRVTESPGSVRFDVDWGAGLTRWEGERIDDGTAWRFSVAPLAEPPSMDR